MAPRHLPEPPIPPFHGPRQAEYYYYSQLKLFYRHLPEPPIPPFHGLGHLLNYY